MSYARLAGLVTTLMFTASVGVSAQARFDPAAAIAAQKAAMTSLAVLDGVWRGPAWTLLDNGSKREYIQTERIGPFLDGAVKVVEGRGYEAATGEVAFNAFGIISFDQASNSYNLHTYAQGRSGDYKLTPTTDGYIWEIQAGPMMIRYTVVIKNGVWHEVGDRIIPGRDPIRFMDMTLTRLGNSDWPAAGAIPKQ